ncbi:molybdopterin-dependent oxidoreductase, partial [Nocardiopsis tropica]|nr:molybdopterin-dependent oxidoreductase [Nocardiopsis tropica]
ILHELVRLDRVDHGYVDAHTVGYEELVERVAEYPPEYVADVCGVPAGDVREAARMLGDAERLLSTVLQGFYQSHQATAASVQVNNVHLIRGMLGRPGAGVLQMNGQPTAENTRECGADGDLTGFRNWSNDAHVADLAAVWNLDPARIPHYAPPTHAMQIMRYAEKGSVRFLWVSATNPAVSLPELRRIRSLLAGQDLFLVVQDIFMTETAELADVVLPAATWGEKTGTLTNSDRTVHLSEKAVDPPGEARPDLDVFLDYARRMDFRDRDGEPFPQWHDPESAFEAWKRASAGRPCDYTGITYAKLRGGSGVQWPCNADNPDGTERLYADGRFWAAPDQCESYGRDLVTGAPADATGYAAMNPSGRAVIRAAEYLEPHEAPDGEYPFSLVTGRTLYQFHTRTKTGRVPQLRRAAPEVWVEVAPSDAEDAGVREGDLVEVVSPRGAVRARARIAGIRPGVLFVPFHYGYWDSEDRGGGEDVPKDRAANEMTVTDWDPVSKQPLFKTSAAGLRLLEPGGGTPAPAPTTTASRPVGEGVPETRGGPGAMAEERVEGGS